MKTNNFISIPALNFNDYQNKPAEFTKQLIITCHDVGFFYLDNHGIPDSLTTRVMQLTKLFFDLPQHEKDKINIHHSPHYRGYGKLNGETTLGEPDYKETYDLGLERAPVKHLQHRYQILHGHNQWPPAAMQLEFRDVIIEYMQRMALLGQQLMHIIGNGLGITSPDFFQQFNPDAVDAFAMLRLLHYPPALQQQNQFGVGPHVDAGCLVFLLQDDVGGLQVQNHHGEWIDAPPRKHSFIVNIGQMLQVWTDHYFTATPHRVLNHHKKHRYSAPFFFEPNLSATVIPQSINQQAIKHSQTGIVYGEHMLKIFERSFARNDTAQ